MRICSRNVTGFHCKMQRILEVCHIDMFKEHLCKNGCNVYFLLAIYGSADINYKQLYSYGGYNMLQVKVLEDGLILHILTINIITPMNIYCYPDAVAVEQTSI